MLRFIIILRTALINQANTNRQPHDEPATPMVFAWGSLSCVLVLRAVRMAVRRVMPHACGLYPYRPGRVRRTVHTRRSFIVCLRVAPCSTDEG